jgi:hypothetical protein
LYHFTEKKSILATLLNTCQKYGNRLQEANEYRIVQVAMKIKQITVMAFALFAAQATPLAIGVSTAAAESTCGGTPTAFIQCDQKNSKDGGVKDNGIWALLLIVLNVLTAGVGLIAVAGIVYGSILYTTAENKADQVKKATDIITNVIIGLVMFALMWAGLNFIVPGGAFA